jgi:ParB family chromosome partitioning protein
LRVILRAIVNLDPYTFADDLAEDIADENDKRSAEEVLLAVIDSTGDAKLTGFAVRLALSGHRAIPRDNEPDFLTEAAAAFLTPKPKKSGAKKAVPARKEPTPIKPAKAAKKKAPAKKDTAQPVENAVAA